MPAINKAGVPPFCTLFGQCCLFIVGVIQNGQFQIYLMPIMPYSLISSKWGKTVLESQTCVFSKMFGAKRFYLQPVNDTVENYLLKNFVLTF